MSKTNWKKEIDKIEGNVVEETVDEELFEYQVEEDTFRAQAAVMAMQALISKGGEGLPEKVAKNAVIYADALIARLEDTASSDVD